jgi:polysaccharide export outer membrane protein
MTSLIVGLLLMVVREAPQMQPAVQAPTDYTVGSDDLLLITVFDEPSLSGEFTVDADGDISYPLLGRIEVRNRTLRQIEDDLTARLKTGKLLVNPQVSVIVKAFRSQTVYVTGEVRNPGAHSIRGATTVMSALLLAGGQTVNSADEILIIRSKDANPSKGPLNPDDEGAQTETVNINDIRSGKLVATLVRDGDTVLVPKAPKFFVQGHVRNTGTYTLTPGLTVRQALVMAGGISERGTDRGIRIIRTVKGKEKELKAELDDPVQANDTITVKQRFF